MDFQKEPFKLQNHDLQVTDERDFKRGQGAAANPRSSDRLQYQAQAQVISNQWGGLEGIRQKLGLSQRKMCQLLLVDPSAWSRWIKGDSDAPPHIYRSLQWFLALKDQVPGITSEQFLNPQVRWRKSDEEARSLREIKSQLEGIAEQSNQWQVDWKSEKSKMETKISTLSRALQISIFFYCLSALAAAVLMFR